MNFVIKDVIKDQIKKTGMYRTLEIENQRLESQLTSLQDNIEIYQKQIQKINDEHNKLLNDRNKSLTVPNFQGYNRCYKGNNGYLFLINDSNNEIRQHFDQSYYNNFNSSLFIEKYNSKTEYCKHNNIKYQFFMIPDKSYICREYLPFDLKIIKRNYDLIKSYVTEFSDKLNPEHYWKTDSHINYLGGKEISYNILNNINNSFTRKDFDVLINEQMDISYDCNKPPYECDLISDHNWSYSNDEKLKYTGEKTLFFNSKDMINLDDNVPEKFNGKRRAMHRLNENSFTDLKFLIFRDSSTNYLTNFLQLYCKEILCYWDYWSFNKELIEWYKPDIILEIRTERLLENMERELIVSE
jgi:hypothetical protein